MVIFDHITSFAERANGVTEVHLTNRAALKLAIPFDEFVDMLTHELKLKYICQEEENTQPG